jgi:hypothetical protein
MRDPKRKKNKEPSSGETATRADGSRVSVRLQLRTLFAVAIVGAVTTGGAYEISDGSITIFVE